jgi:hypothetical protein
LKTIADAFEQSEAAQNPDQEPAAATGVSSVNLKKKSQKYASYICQSLVHQGKHWIILINNIHKFIALLNEEEGKEEKMAINFFKISQPVMKSGEGGDEEMKNEEKPESD